jgi:putative membrane protein
MPENDEPEQLKLTRQLVELAKARTKMSAARSEMSAERSEMSAERSAMAEERSYMNAERTLSVWVRTAMALMIFGIAIDRFGLVLHRLPKNTALTLSNWCGMALVALGILMAVVTGARFLAYASRYLRNHELPYHHGPYLAPFFSLMVALFGLALLIIMLVFTE